MLLQVLHWEAKNVIAAQNDTKPLRPTANLANGRAPLQTRDQPSQCAQYSRFIFRRSESNPISGRATPLIPEMLYRGFPDDYARG